MAIYREDSGGSLHEVGPVYREDSGGTLHEIGVIYREDSGGTLHEVYRLAKAEDLYPNADVSESNFTDSGGGTQLWDDIDETSHDSDTTYIESSTVTSGGSLSANFETDLENAAEPHSNSQTHRVHIVCKRREDFGPEDGTVELTNVNLKEGGTTRGSATPGQFLTESYVDYTFDISVSGITDWSDLSIQFVFDVDATTNSQTSCRVTQVYLEIF